MNLSIYVKLGDRMLCRLCAVGCCNKYVYLSEIVMLATEDVCTELAGWTRLELISL